MAIVGAADSSRAIAQTLLLFDKYLSRRAGLRCGLQHKPSHRLGSLPTVVLQMEYPNRRTTRDVGFKRSEDVLPRQLPGKHLF